MGARAGDRRKRLRKEYDLGRALAILAGLANDELAVHGIGRRCQFVTKGAAGAVDDVDLEEGAVIIAHVKVKQLVVVAQHRGDHIDRRIVDTGFAHGRQRCKDFDTVAHIFELRIDAACGALCNLVNEGPGGGANDRCDACETEIDQRQSDDGGSTRTA